MAWYSAQAEVELRREAAEGVGAVLAGRRPAYAVVEGRLGERGGGA